MTEPLEAPYPIRRQFRRRVAPALGAVALLLAVVSWFSINRLELHVYLETTERRARATTYLAHQLAPAAWDRLASGHEPLAVLREPAGATLSALLQGLGGDPHVTLLKVFNSRKITVFSTDEKDIGVREENEVLKEVLATGRAQIEATTRNGEKLYEIYAPIRDGRTHEMLVFEIYEPAAVFDEIILESFAQTTLAPLAILLAIGLWLERLTGRAQADIDRRVETHRGLRRQLERFVSRSAVGAVRMSADGAVVSSRVGMTLFYSDVRDFTSLAELHPPQETVNFLNTLMTIQVEIVRRHGGDVDKMIGDALLVRFEGTDREARAIGAAREIQDVLAERPMARGIGIGIYDGEAVLGVIGPEERQDFTVIGDSVNIAARLCSIARQGEVIVDELALRRSGLDDQAFSRAEKHRVKGRSGAIMVRRWQTGAAEPVPVRSAPDPESTG
jgi:class 3 adenylate cyclase